MADVGQQLATLQSSLSALTPSISFTSSGSLFSSVTVAAKESLSNITSKPSPLSYAAIVSCGESNAVKRAVVKTFSKQSRADRDSATVAVHGMPENGSDSQDFHAILDKLGCKMEVMSCIRLGRAMTDTSKAGSKA